MADPASNPTTHPPLSGRRQVHVRHTSEVRNVRTDPESEAALQFAKRHLSGDLPTDRPSVSMITRRALKTYKLRLASLLGNPEGLREEYRAVREGSRLPRLRKQINSTA
jgi:hypothetical protein